MARTSALTRLPAPWRWAWAGALLGLCLTLLWQAPARWLTGAVQQASQGRVTFLQVRGTVWQGSGRVTLTGGAGSLDAAILPGRLSWQLRPTLTGLAAELTAECCTQAPWRIGVQPRWKGAKFVVADSQSQWPAMWLSGLGTPWNTVQPEGQLLLSTQGLVMEWAQGGMVLAGRAQLDAQHLSSRLSTLKPMGSYRLTFQGGDAPAFSLETLEGSLLLSGQGQWVGARLRFQGEASAAPDRLDALSNLLNILGRRDGARSLITLG
jgi:general secretion pathway protein N